MSSCDEQYASGWPSAEYDIAQVWFWHWSISTQASCSVRLYGGFGRSSPGQWQVLPLSFTGPPYTSTHSAPVPHISSRIMQTSILSHSSVISFNSNPSSHPHIHWTGCVAFGQVAFGVGGRRTHSPFTRAYPAFTHSHSLPSVLFGAKGISRHSSPGEGQGHQKHALILVHPTPSIYSYPSGHSQIRS